MNYSNPGCLRLQRGMVGGQVGEIVSDTELDYAGYITGNTNLNCISAMRSMYNRLSDGADVPDLILSGQDVFETYEAALTPLERFTDMKVGDAGFQNLKFKTATMIFDHGLSAGLPSGAPTVTNLPAPCYFLNSDYLEWTVDVQSDFTTTPFYRPHKQAARTAQILLMANLCCSNRSKMGVISFANSDGVYTPA
jgi:hypothetical protein